MGGETSVVQGEPVAGGADPSEENFYHAFVQKEEDPFKSKVVYQADPYLLMQVLMTNSEVVPDPNEAMQFLVDYSDGDFKQIDFLKVFYQEFIVSKTLARIRLLDTTTPSTKTEGEHMSFISEAMMILFQYVYGLKYDNERITHIISLLTELNPGPNLIPPQKECIFSDNSFTGLCASSIINPRGIASNGSFLFALTGDMLLHVFPILDNGALLSPFTRSLKLEPNNSAQISVGKEGIIVHSYKKFIFSLETILIVSEEKVAPISASKPIQAPLIITDGVVKVAVDSNYIASIYFADSDTPFHSTYLSPGNANVKIHQQFPDLLTQAMIMEAPAQTNGAFLAFYLKIDETHMLVREFSLLTGQHVGDEEIEVDAPIISCCLDMIHCQHWVTTANTGRAIIRAYQYNGVIDPFAFKLLVPRIEGKKEQANSVEKMVELLNLNLLASIGSKVSPYLILETEDELQSLLSNILNMITGSERIPQSKRLMFILILQIFVIVAAMNAPLLGKNNEKVREQIVFILVRLPDKYRDEMTVNLIALLLYRTIHFVMCEKLYNLLVAVLQACHEQLNNVLMGVISNSNILAFVPCGSDNAISRFLTRQGSVKDLNRRLFSLLLAQQRVLVREAIKELKADVFSSVRVFKSKMRPQTALDHLCDYAQVIVNQLTSELGNMKTFEELDNSLIFHLFNNFLIMLWGMADFHAVAQIILPLLSVLPGAMKTFFDRIGCNAFAEKRSSDAFTRLGFSFGVFAATLVKGGDFSDFEDRNKWIIRPNMNLMNQSDLLESLTRKGDAGDEQDLDFIANGAPKMQILYKIWKPALNRRLKDDIQYYDRLVLAAILKHTNLYKEFNDILVDKKLDERFRKLLDSVFKARNDYIAHIRTGESTEQMFTKIRMLMRMKSEFTEEDDPAKLIVGFINSKDTPESIVHFISNQKIRITLTGIGFSLVQSVYQHDINQSFYQTVASALSNINNFDGLASCIRGSGESHTFINNFLKLVSDSGEPHLMLLAHKLFKSKVVEPQTIAEFLKPIFIELIHNQPNPSQFAICAHYVGYIPNALDLLPPIEEMNPMHLYFIGDIIETTKQCTMMYYQKILKFALSCKSSLARNTMRALRIALQYVKIRKDQLKRDLTLILDYLGKCLLELSQVHVACEIVSLFRQILIDCNDIGDILLNIIATYKPETAKDHQVCAVFAILGGNIEVNRPFCAATVRTALDRETRVITVGNKHDCAFFELPFTADTQRRFFTDYSLIPQPTIEFNPYMFPDFDFIQSFYFRCTKRFDTSMAVIYIQSLISYVEVSEFADAIREDVLKDITCRLAGYMNPCDTMQQTIEQLMVVHSKKTIDPLGDFGRMVGSNFQSVVYLSPCLVRGAQTTVTIRTDSKFIGFIGIVDDGPNPNVDYQLIHIPSRVVYPSRTQIKMDPFDDVVKFDVNESNRTLTVGRSTVKMRPGKGAIRIFVTAVDNIKIQSIIASNTTKVFDLSMPKEPVVVGFNGDFDPNSHLYNFPQWTVMSMNDSREKLKNIYNLERFQDLQVPAVDYTFWRSRPPRNIPIHPLEAEEMSQFLMESASAHFFTKLFTQWTTALVIKLVANGYANAFAPHRLMRLFSLLLIILEPFSSDDLSHNLFPFHLDSSVLTPHAPSNNINFNLHIQAKIALQAITQTENFMHNIVMYTQNLHARQETHILADPLVPVSFFPCGDFEMTLNVDASPAGASMIIIGFSAFNTTQNRDVRVEGSRHPLPYVSKSPKVTLDFMDDSYLSNPVAALHVSKWHTSWAVGTIFELLLLVRQLSLLGIEKTNPVFIRGIILDMLLMQSPFGWMFVRKFLTHFSQNFVTHDSINNAYIQRLLLLGAFINRVGDKGDLQVSSFFIQEQRALTSNLPFLLAPFFPEFIATKQQPPQSPNVKIPIPELIFKPNKADIHSLFLLYQNLVAERSTFEGFPFYEILPLWIAISNTMNDDKPSNDEPPTFRKVTDNIVEITNHSNRQCHISIIPVARIPQNAIVMISSTRLFEDCEIIQLSELPRTFGFAEQHYFVSLTGADNLSIDMLDISAAPDLTEARATELTIQPGKIHDEFVEDMRLFVFKWRPEQTRDLVLCFPSQLFEQPDFTLLKEGALNSPLLATFPPRVVLLYALFIHRFNYMWQKYRATIPETINHRVMDFISSEDASKDFIREIAVSSSSPPDIKVDRHEAHRIVLDGGGDPHKTMIAQFTKQISGLSENKMRVKERPWCVSFVGEGAIDAGGPRRELFNEVSSSIFQPTSNLFILSPNGRYHCGSFRDVYVPATTLGRAATAQYTAIGTFLGVVIRNGYPQLLPFAPLVWKYIAGELLGETDILMIDERLKTQFDRLRIAKNDTDFVSRFSLRWTVEGWDGTVEPLTAQHHEPFVTGDNVELYIDECIQMRINAITPYLNLIKRGFAVNVGFETHPMMSSGLLSILAQGTNIVTAAQLKQITSFVGFSTNNHPAILNFWAAVERMSNEQRSMLLRFVTTLTRLPNRQVNPSFHITVSRMSDGNDDRLPGAATCFNKMYLPSYSTSDIAFKKITLAIELCDTMENT